MSTESYRAGYIDGAAAKQHYKQRCEQLEQLCRGLYRILELVGKPYDSEKINRYLDEDGFAQVRRYMDVLGLLEVENG